MFTHDEARLSESKSKLIDWKPGDPAVGKVLSDLTVPGRTGSAESLYSANVTAFLLFFLLKTAGVDSNWSQLPLMDIH